MDHAYIEARLKGLKAEFNAIPDVCRELGVEDQSDWLADFPGDLDMLERLTDLARAGKLTARQSEELQEVHLLLERNRHYIDLIAEKPGFFQWQSEYK